ncbi:hypothetical protein Tco_0780493 [Tanacetum coccineum]
MIKYRENVLELAGVFNKFQITHIPRAENRKADALSTLATVQFDHLSKEVLVEVLNERFVEAQAGSTMAQAENALMGLDHVAGYRQMKLGVTTKALKEVEVSKRLANGPTLPNGWRQKPLATQIPFIIPNEMVAGGKLRTENLLERINYTYLLEGKDRSWAEEEPNIGMPTHRTSSVNEKTNDQELRLNLDLLDERRKITAIREARVCGKLGTTWEGHYKVIKAFQSEAYKLSNMEGKRDTRTLHACNLRSATSKNTRRDLIFSTMALP